MGILWQYLKGLVDFRMFLSPPLDPSHPRPIPNAKLVNKQLQIPKYAIVNATINAAINPNCYTNFALVIKINFAK